MRRHAAFLMFAVLIFTSISFAQQDKNKRPSPPASAQCKFSDGKSVTVDYSAPSMRGRKIYGGLVPYNQVWRAGANEATTFVTTANLDVNGTSVPAGSYTLFTLPSENNSKLIISKKTGEWGIPYPGQGDDLARIDMKKETLPSPVEKFNIAFDQTGPDSCRLSMDWETTRASVDIKEKQ
jgi:hypothetical protein